MSVLRDNTDDIMFVVNRLGYGTRTEEYSAIVKQGVNGWLEEQLSAPADDDAATKEKLDACRLHIKYDADQGGKWQAMDENRPLSTLKQPIEEIWPPLFDPQKPVNGQERAKPRNDVIAATLIRAVYSKYQLREIMTQFWHDHFHVNAVGDEHIAVALPTYDRDVIRKNCMGNFRAMTEAVASSAAMQYYLSNHSSRAGSANENYARELFELHSFGRENYLNDRYDRWRDVPGAAEGKPAGYIDQDVYEAARAFTGWTIEDGGQIDSGRKLPNTGKFAYVENWHDGYQKRVLASEFDPFAQPMADGRKVLDLIAAHPAVSRHIVGKLCVRMAGPGALSSLIDRATEVWRANAEAPDQIARTVRVIATSDEFMASRGAKVKRPLALMANYARIMGYDFTPTEGIANQIANAGQRLFGWPTPTGLPDDNAYYLGTNFLRNRWNLMLGMAQNWWQTGTPDAARTLSAWGGKVVSGDATVAEWFHLFGIDPADKLVETTTVAAGLLPYAAPGEGDDKHMATAAAIAAMAPDFQTC
jgi:uncharacterized protein (DUF1800 family)